MRYHPRRRYSRPDGGVNVMSALFGMFPFLLKNSMADSGLSGTEIPAGIEESLAADHVEIVSGRCRQVRRATQTLDRSSERSAGSTDAAGWPRIGNA